MVFPRLQCFFSNSGLRWVGTRAAKAKASASPEPPNKPLDTHEIDEALKVVETTLKTPSQHQNPPQAPVIEGSGTSSNSPDASGSSSKAPAARAKTVTPTSKALKAPPVLPKEISKDPIGDAGFAIVSVASNSRDQVLKSNDSELNQRHIRYVRDILKYLANIQRDVGQISDVMSKHNGTLRQAAPKGKPPENHEIQRNGVTYIYSYGKYVPLTSIDPK